MRTNCGSVHLVLGAGVSVWRSLPKHPMDRHPRIDMPHLTRVPQVDTSQEDTPYITSIPHPLLDTTPIPCEQTDPCENITLTILGMWNV